MIVFPTADVSSTGWTPTPLWQSLDDADEGSAVSSADTADETGFEVSLADFSPGGGAGWSVVALCRAAGLLEACDARIELVQGATVIASNVEPLPSTGSWVSCGFALSSGQVATITDVNDLRLRARKLSSPTALPMMVGYLYLEVASGFAHVDVEASTGALLVVGAGDGHFLDPSGDGSVERRAGVEGSGALIVDGNDLAVRP